MVLIAPHDPLPLLAQLAQREGDAVEVSYLQRTRANRSGRVAPTST